MIVQQGERAGRVVYLSEVPTETPPQMFADEPDVFGVTKAAELLDVVPNTIRREIARGRLGCFHVGTRVRITKESLIKYIMEGTNED